MPDDAQHLLRSAMHSAPLLRIVKDVEASVRLPASEPKSAG